MNIPMTLHAAARQQQRGIPPLIMEWLSTYGACRHDHRGVEILYFDKQSRKALARDVGEEIVSRLSALLDTYAVVSDSGSVITVGHRFKRVCH
uniref:DUF4258 domain-containing protein n=1 Tax=Dechloromonas aromatica (strain RCB) TaxID=159087 RepID=Q47GB6_DECAR